MWPFPGPGRFRVRRRRRDRRPPPLTCGRDWAWADRVSAAPDPRAGAGERLGPDHIWVSWIVRQVISPGALVPRPGPLTRSPSRLRLLF
jgi:hypothetical protein